MEFLPAHETMIHWLTAYGSITLFILLALGIIALPVPEETLMVLAGVLMSNGTLRVTPTVLAAFFGSVAGITTSYLLGRTAGIYLVHKYGPMVGIKDEHIVKAHSWFERYGKWTLFIGYFVPGLRHFSGVFAGTSYLDYKNFALFAYMGALFWVSTFLSIGYFFGPWWLKVFEAIEIKLDTTTVLLIGTGVGLYFLYYFKKSKP